MSVADLIQRARARDAKVVTLARTLSLASRVEPALLRAARLLVPGAHVGTESALWSSTLVGRRSAEAIVLRADVARVLQEDLARDRVALDGAWTLLSRAHAHLAPALRLEERLAYLALSNAGDDALDHELTRVAKALHEPDRPGLVSWAERALGRTPSRVRARPVARALGGVVQAAVLGAGPTHGERLGWRQGIERWPGTMTLTARVDGEALVLGLTRGSWFDRKLGSDSWAGRWVVPEQEPATFEVRRPTTDGSTAPLLVTIPLGREVRVPLGRTQGATIRGAAGGAWRVVREETAEGVGILCRPDDRRQAEALAEALGPLQAIVVSRVGREADVQELLARHYVVILWGEGPTMPCWRESVVKREVERARARITAVLLPGAHRPADLLADHPWLDVRETSDPADEIARPVLEFFQESLRSRRRRLETACTRVWTGSDAWLTGYLVAPDVIATAAHGLPEGDVPIRVTFEDGDRTAWRVLQDKERDAALLRLERPQYGAPPLDFEPVREKWPAPGETTRWECFAFDAPHGAGRWIRGQGLYHDGRSLQLQDVVLRPGSSGGPVFVNARVVGHITHVVGQPEVPA